jgi:hypothetical protein
MNDNLLNLKIQELQQKINEIGHDLKISNHISNTATQNSEITLQALVNLNQNLAMVSNVLLTHKDLILQDSTAHLSKTHKNPLNHYGQKCFSQTDEDGITDLSGFFEPVGFRDNGSSHLRSSDEASEVYRRADRSNIARGG